MKKTVTSSLLVLLSVSFFAGCTSEESRLRATLEKNVVEGKYNSAYYSSKEVLEQKETYSEETINVAMEVQSKAFQKLLNSHRSLINNALKHGNLEDGIGRYNMLDDEMANILESDIEIQQRLAHAHVVLGDFRAAEAAMTLANTYADRGEIKDATSEYLERLRELEELHGVLVYQTETIKTAAKQYEFMVNEKGELATHCSFTANEESVPDHILDLISKHTDEVGEYEYLMSELGNPASVRSS